MSEIKKSVFVVDAEDGIPICPDCKVQIGEGADHCKNCALYELEYAITGFEDGDPIELLRLCAKTLESPSNWYIGVIQARANWLRRFASHLEKVRKP